MIEVVKPAESVKLEHDQLFGLIGVQDFLLGRLTEVLWMYDPNTVGVVDLLEMNSVESLLLVDSESVSGVHECCDRVHYVSSLTEPQVCVPELLWEFGRTAQRYSHVASPCQ